MKENKIVAALVGARGVDWVGYREHLEVMEILVSSEWRLHRCIHM